MPKAAAGRIRTVLGKICIAVVLAAGLALPRAAQAETVHVAVAANFTGVAEQLAPLFEATNSEMYRRMTEDMDVDSGRIVSEGLTIEESGREIYDLIIRVASGEQSKSEAQGLGDFEFVPWQIGATM